MAECSSAFSAADLHCRVECPVCFDIFRNPKALNCGHSLCRECSEQLIKGEGVFEVPVVLCPVCRSRNVVPEEGLPTNFSLADLVNQVVSQESKKLFECAACAKKFTANETWLCHSCGKSALYCSTCSLKEHRGHSLQELEDLLMNRRKELDIWKEKVSKNQRGLQMRNRDVTNEATRLGCRLRSLAKLLEKGSDDWVKNRSREIFRVSREINKIYTEFKEIDSKLMSKNVVESQLQNEKEMQAISEKQGKISEEQEVIMTLLGEVDVKLQGLDELRPNFKSILDTPDTIVKKYGEYVAVDSLYGPCCSPRKLQRMSPEEDRVSPEASVSLSPNYTTPPGVISDSDNSLE